MSAGDSGSRWAHAPTHSHGLLEELERRFNDALPDSPEAGHAALLAVVFAAKRKVRAPSWAAELVASIVEAYETSRAASIADAFGMPDRGSREIDAGRRNRDALRLAVRLQQIRREPDFNGRKKSDLVAREELAEEVGGAYTAPQIGRIVSQWRADLRELGLCPDAVLHTTDAGILLGGS